MKSSGSVSYLVKVDKLPDNVFGVSRRRSGTIRRRLAEKGIKTVSATRVGNLTYLEFETESKHERAVKWIYRWYEAEFDEAHWDSSK